MGFWTAIKSLIPQYGKDFSSGGWDGRQLNLWDSSHPLNLTSALGSGGSDRERIENDFQAYTESAYKRNGPIFACIAARQFVFSEATFKWQKDDEDTGRPGELFTTPALNLLSRPWRGGTTGELLVRMEQDASLAGNSWWTKCDRFGNYGNAARPEGLHLAHLRPDWVELVIGSRTGDPFALDSHVIMVVYKPKTNGIYDSPAASQQVFLLPEEVVHYSPIPDPVARFRGMSWVTPIVREIQSDSAATTHKKAFFENAAVPNMVVRFDKDTSEDSFDEFVEQYREKHQGHWNAYKTLFLMGGADVTPLTHNFQQLEFTASQGKGESRIAAAAGVPSSWIGFSEGMQGSSLNSGNFSAARRRFADGTIRPLWRMAAASLEQLFKNTPDGAHLWFDDRDIAFLREDAQDRAKIIQTEANAIDSLIKGGFEADAAVQAIRFQDLGRLMGKHTGLVSVQMQSATDAEERDVRLDATAIHTLVAAGFTHESVIDAVWQNNLELLVEDPNAMLLVAGGNPLGGPKVPSKPGDSPPAPGSPTSESEFDKPDVPAGEE